MDPAKTTPTGRVIYYTYRQECSWANRDYPKDPDAKVTNEILAGLNLNSLMKFEDVEKFVRCQFRLRKRDDLAPNKRGNFDGPKQYRHLLSSHSWGLWNCYRYPSHLMSEESLLKQELHLTEMDRFNYDRMSEQYYQQSAVPSKLWWIDNPILRWQFFYWDLSGSSETYFTFKKAKEGKFTAREAPLSYIGEAARECVKFPGIIDSSLFDGYDVSLLREEVYRLKAEIYDRI